MKSELFNNLKFAILEAIECTKDEFSDETINESLQEAVDEVLAESECNGMATPDYTSNMPSEAELEDAQNWLDGVDVPNMLLKEFDK